MSVAVKCQLLEAIEATQDSRPKLPFISREVPDNKSIAL